MSNKYEQCPVCTVKYLYGHGHLGHCSRECYLATEVKRLKQENIELKDFIKEVKFLDAWNKLEARRATKEEMLSI